VWLLDACVPGACEHFDSLYRWIRLVVPNARLLRDADGEQTSDLAAPDVIVAHVAARDAAEDWRAEISNDFPNTTVIVAVHGHGRPCLADDTLESVRRSLADVLGSAQPFQVLPGVVGCSTALCQAADQVRLIASADAVCLLQGETGTGKELFARAIHYLSERKRRPFVPVNCGAIQDTLFENEMFGHARGAFTDARDERQGLLAYAEGGTIFLDEVDCLSTSAQVKLLRVLQEREYRPVGSARSVRSDVRIVAATNTDLRKRVEQRLFREDLFHRLNVLRLFIPPLRARQGDAPLLARTFVRDFARRYKRQPPALADDVFRAIEAYDWPGNVREMQAVFERAVLLARNGAIVAADLEIAVPAAAAPVSMQRAKESAIENFERSYLRELLSRCAGNVSQAARIACKERRAFQRLLRKHNLTRDEFVA
jgi:DNA-binding NtrC family response regulator